MIFRLQEPAEQAKDEGGHATAPEQTAVTSSAPGDSGGQPAQPYGGALPPLPVGLPLTATAAPVVEEDDYDAFD